MYKSQFVQGDNRVLMQKVSKELLAFVQAGKRPYRIPTKTKSTDIRDIRALCDILIKRENQYCINLLMKLRVWSRSALLKCLTRFLVQNGTGEENVRYLDVGGK